MGGTGHRRACAVALFLENATFVLRLRRVGFWIHENSLSKSRTFETRGATTCRRGIVAGILMRCAETYRIWNTVAAAFKWRSFAVRGREVGGQSVFADCGTGGSKG